MAMAPKVRPLRLCRLHFYETEGQIRLEVISSCGESQDEGPETNQKKAEG